MKFGRPEQFLDKATIRLRAIDRDIAQSEFIATELRKPFEATLTPQTAICVKGFGNEVHLVASTRDLFFASRELLDVYLGRLSATTASTGKQTPKNIIPLLKRLNEGEFEAWNKDILMFCKTDTTYLFHMQKIRNHLKSDPLSVDFIFKTNHFELRMALPLNSDEMGLLPHLDVINREEAKANKRYHAAFNLDISFPEMSGCWRKF